MLFVNNHFHAICDKTLDYHHKHVMYEVSTLMKKVWFGPIISSDRADVVNPRCLDQFLCSAVQFFVM